MIMGMMKKTSLNPVPRLRHWFRQHRWLRFQDCATDCVAKPEQLCSKIALLVGLQDTLADRADDRWLWNQLGGKIKCYKSYHSFDYFSFNVGKHMSYTSDVLDLLKGYGGEKDEGLEWPGCFLNINKFNLLKLVQLLLEL